MMDPMREKNVLQEEEESEDIVIADEGTLPEDGKVYPKEHYPTPVKHTRPAGLLPGGADESDEDDEEDERNVKYFVPKFTPEDIEEFMFDLMLCVRTSVLNGSKMAEGLEPSSLPDSTFRDQQSYELNRGGTDHKIYLTDYAATAFHLIRESFGISSSSFLLAWSANDIKAAQVEGSSLIYSCDKRFLAMPLLDRELDVLLEMLPRYYEYIRQNPHTLLMKMVGLMRVYRGKKLAPYLLVENLLHQHIPLHRMFHIAAPISEAKSGMLSRVSSTLRRRSSSASKMTLSRSRGALGTLHARTRSSSLILDPPAFKEKLGMTRSTVYGNETSWRSEGRNILVPKNLKASLLKQLVDDMSFLQECGITEHKVLVGIHEGEPIAPPSPDLESRRLVKVPSMVVFQSTATPSKAQAKQGKPLEEETPSASTPIAGSAFDLSNLRRGRRVSIQSMDSDQPALSPYRNVKGGLYAREGDREELYYIGIIDIFAILPKEKKRTEKASARFTAFNEWINDSFVEMTTGGDEPVSPPSTPLTKADAGSKPESDDGRPLVALKMAKSSSDEDTSE